MLMQKITRWVALFGGFCLLALMFLSVVSVFLRKVAGAPLLGALDLTQMGMVVVVFSSFAYCGKIGGHVCVELADAVLSPRKLRFLKIAVSFVTAAFAAFLAYNMVLKALSAIRFNEATMLIQMPFAPFILIAAGGLALFSVAMLSVAVHDMRNADPILKTTRDE